MDDFDFTSFLTVFQSYQDDVRMIMKSSVQCNSAYLHIKGKQLYQFIFPLLFVGLNSKSKFYVVRVQLFWKFLNIRVSKQDVTELAFIGDRRCIHVRAVKAHEQSH